MLKQTINSRFKKAGEVLLLKGKEYSSPENRYYQFIEAAKIMNTSPAIALLGMQVKHLTPVIDMINGKIVTTHIKIDEKFGDMFNYYILLAGLNKSKENLVKVLTEIRDSYCTSRAINKLSLLSQSKELLVDKLRVLHSHFVLKIKDKTFDWEMFGDLLGLLLVLEHRLTLKMEKENGIRISDESL